MREVGQIVRLQIQVNSLKQGQRPHRYYDPAGIRSVPALRLTNEGVVGLVDGQEIMDMHHTRHPAGKNRGSNAISINFTSHYARMRARFGPLALGCAGENLLVQTDSVLALADLAQGLVLVPAGGPPIHLSPATVATPCMEFSEYVLNLGEKPPATLLQETLRFLDAGTRGFYVLWSGAPVVTRPGDRLYLPAA